MQIIQRTLSDLEYVASLTGPTRDVVLAAYVRSFEYAHGEGSVSSLFLVDCEVGYSGANGHSGLSDL